MSHDEDAHRAVEILQPFWRISREAIVHLEKLGELCQTLSEAKGICDIPISDIKAEHITRPTALLIEALYADIEMMVRTNLRDHDLFDGPVAEAHQKLLDEHRRQSRTS